MECIVHIAQGLLREKVSIGALLCPLALSTILPDRRTANGEVGRLMYQLDVHRNRYFVGVTENPLFCICSTSLANGPLKTSVSVLQYEEMGGILSDTPPCRV